MGNFEFNQVSQGLQMPLQGNIGLLWVKPCSTEAVCLDEISEVDFEVVASQLKQLYQHSVL